MAPSNIDTTEIWERFEGRGTGSITDAEVRILLQEVQGALNYLVARHRRYTLAWIDATHVENTLLQNAGSRGMKNVKRWRPPALVAKLQESATRLRDESS